MKDEKKHSYEELQKDEIKLLHFLTNVCKNLEKRISSLEKLNWKELRRESEVSEYYLQLKEFGNLISALDDAVTILDYLKNYTRYFMYEAKENMYVSPEFKTNIINNITNVINDIREKVNRIFVEFQILFDEINRF